MCHLELQQQCATAALSSRTACEKCVAEERGHVNCTHKDEQTFCDVAAKGAQIIAGGDTTSSWYCVIAGYRRGNNDTLSQRCQQRRTHPAIAVLSTS